MKQGNISSLHLLPKEDSITGLVVCLVKRTRMKKGAFITGITLCLLPVAVLAAYIVLSQVPSLWQ